MGNELKKWRVTGPDGFEETVELAFNHGIDNQKTAMFKATIARRLSTDQLMRQAGYRAEPIEEPKMVTVPETLVRAALWLGEIGHESLVKMVSIQGIPRTDYAKRTINDLRAALDGAN